MRPFPQHVFAGNANIRMVALHSPSVMLARVVLFDASSSASSRISALDASYSNNSETSKLLPYLTHAIGAIAILLAGN